MQTQSQLSISGSLGLTVFPRVRPAPVAWRLTNFLRYRLRDLPRLWAGRLANLLLGVPILESRLYLRKIDRRTGLVVDYGLVSTRLVTTAGVNFIVDAFQGSTELENLRYHGFGTGTNAEATGDTALQTEETTQYASDNTRPTGSLAEGASANIFRTVATYSPDSGGTRAITEHGVLSQAGTGGGTLLDRSVFSAVNLAAGADSLQATYEITVSAGG
jgi:hypothetical protein